jgi:C4-dicarboxylate-specific signal transduction histidine kinase
MDFIDPMTLDLVWHSLGGGAIVAAGLALVRVVIEYGFRRRERRMDQLERRRTYQRDAEARLERQLHERLNEAALRLERCQLEVEAERNRRTALERDYALLQQAHHLLSDQFGALQTDHAVLIGEHRLLLAAQHARPSAMS